MRGRVRMRFSGAIPRGEDKQQCQVGGNRGVVLNLVGARLDRAARVFLAVAGRLRALIPAAATLKEAEARNGLQRAVHCDWHPKGQQ